MAENPRIEELRRRLEREPGSRLFAQLAEELRKDGNHAEAIRVARAGLAQQPNYPSARMTLGRALLDSGDLAGARVEFETVMRGAPDNILASRFLAECLEGLGDLGSALLQYRAAQRLAPADKYLEAQIRALEQKLSAPATVRSSAPAPAPSPPVPPPPPIAPPVAEVSPPPVTGAPKAPPPPRGSVTAEFEAQARSRTPAAPPSARPPLPLPPEPEPLPATTLVEESFDLEAPFVAPTRLRAEESAALPGRALPEEPEAPTLPASPAPTFDPLPLEAEIMAEEPALIPEPPRPPLAEPTREPPPPPRVEERPLPPAPGDAVDTTRVPVVVFPAPAAPPKPALDAIRLEWAPAPTAAPEVPAKPAAPIAPPVPPPPPPSAPAVAREPTPEPGPLLSPTLAELYFGQGALDKAAEVYEQLLQREPANERHRTRLTEIRRAASPPPVPTDDQRAARRQAIEAQIARLERLLTVMRRA